jgi:hypothetical protein
MNRMRPMSLQITINRHPKFLRPSRLSPARRQSQLNRMPNHSRPNQRTGEVVNYEAGKCSAWVRENSHWRRHYNAPRTHSALGDRPRPRGAAVHDSATGRLICTEWPDLRLHLTDFSSLGRDWKRFGAVHVVPARRSLLDAPKTVPFDPR